MLEVNVHPKGSRVRRWVMILQLFYIDFGRFDINSSVKGAFVIVVLRKDTYERI